MISKDILFSTKNHLDTKYRTQFPQSRASLVTKCFHLAGQNGSNKDHYTTHDLGVGDSSAVPCHALHHHNPSTDLQSSRPCTHSDE